MNEPEKFLEWLFLEWLCSKFTISQSDGLGGLLETSHESEDILNQYLLETSNHEGSGYTQWVHEAKRFSEKEADSKISSSLGSHNFKKVKYKDMLKNVQDMK